MGPTTNRLRDEPKSGGLDTSEAIARAVQTIEGEEVWEALNAVFMEMVQRTPKTRGPLS